MAEPFGIVAQIMGQCNYTTLYTDLIYSSRILLLVYSPPQTKRGRKEIISNVSELDILSKETTRS